MTDTSSGPPSPPIWEDFLEVFYAPSQVFARNRGFGIPLLVLVVTMTVLFFATQSAMEPVFDAEFNRAMAAQMKANPQMTAENVERARGFAKKLGSVFFITYFAFAPFLVGFCLWVAGKLVDAKEEVGQAITVATYAYYPRVLEGILGAFQALTLSEAKLNSRYSVTLGIGRLLNPDTTSPVLLALVGRVDVFTLWVTALLAVGLSVTGKIPRGQAAIAAALVWVIGALPGVLGALRAG
jgi:uncharacterized membrane protein (DUF485 family)